MPSLFFTLNNNTEGKYSNNATIDSFPWSRSEADLKPPPHKKSRNDDWERRTSGWAALNVWSPTNWHEFHALFILCSRVLLHSMYLSKKIFITKEQWSVNLKVVRKSFSQIFLLLRKLEKLKWKSDLKLDNFAKHTVRKSQIVSKLHLFKKIQNCDFEFLVKNQCFLEFLNVRCSLNSLNFGAKKS